MPITIDGNGTIAGLSSGGIAANTITAATIASGQTFSLNGIAFPASQVASSNANTLDDYEEGTWTPVLTPNSGSITTQSSYGYYTKIGNSVTILFAVRVTTGGTASGVGYISGLPFTAQSVSPALAGSRSATASVREDGLTGNWYFAYIYANDTQMTLSSSTNGALSYSDNATYVASFVYRSAS